MEKEIVPKIIEFKDLKRASNFEKLKNSIIHGDALKVLHKLPSNSINLIITSPPYMVGKEYEEEQTLEEYKTFHKKIIEESKRILKPNGAIYWNVAQTPIDGEILPLGAVFYNLFKEVGGLYLKNWIIWHFEGGLNTKNRLSGRYENILWIVKDTKNFVFNLDDIRTPPKWFKDKRNNPLGKNPTDFWEFNNIWEINRVVNVSKEKTTHPCQFPEKMIERIIKASSNKGDIVLDMFNGSGTTCKVSSDLGRNFIGIDKEKKYCKIAKKRVEVALKQAHFYNDG